MNFKKTILLLWLIAISLTAVAQIPNGNKETKEAYLLRLNRMVDSIKAAKKEGKQAKQPNTNTGYSYSQYGYSKSTVDNAYNYLTAAEKEKVKNFPTVPEAFRTSIDAQDFLTKMNAINAKTALAQYAKEKSMPLTGYCITYLSIQNKAEAIVRDAEKVKNDFYKLNPKINFGKDVGKTYVSENGLVYLPLGDASFADEVVTANYISGNIQFAKENCIGTPNYVLMKDLKNNKGIYSLGLNGSLVIQFINNALVDVNGPDLFVFEAGEIEPTNVEISKDGKNWVAVGTISGGTAAIDISKVAKPNDYFYYIKLTDLNTKSTIAGADIDAIAAIGSAIKLSLNAEILFDLGKANLKPDGIAAVKKMAKELVQLTKGTITVDGYTDDIGTDDSNQKLSLERAKTVSKLLQQEIKNSGAFTFAEYGKGKLNPIAPNTNDENRKKNRRVEIVIAQ